MCIVSFSIPPLVCLMSPFFVKLLCVTSCNLCSPVCKNHLHPEGIQEDTSVWGVITSLYSMLRFCSHSWLGHGCDQWDYYNLFPERQLIRSTTVTQTWSSLTFKYRCVILYSLLRFLKGLLSSWAQPLSMMVLPLTWPFIPKYRTSIIYSLIRLKISSGS